MSAVPKKKPSRTRTRRRRTVWLKKHKLAQHQRCPECGKLKLPHRVCKHCGFYNGEKVVEIKEKKEKKKQ
ncbi:50S ribosomal protein L32 [Patescibacteria group bacterium]|nr:50S ribosomal protein L32 [Patescibacteria group bacterium]